ncbi:selenide, water dikinase SelD [Caldibacillus lycopersici]|uniref:Selenide, water dikinase n=1 Tax=Perspicuibacillus lycopersici TaxID=1325689 RepID=A0AAE3IR71_9BACI|nr:selenide, water dikinase SelD [Perspicuibacillus lycopersici]MCU9613088.1 selenide, water dikinase SelD [Perspicuibacillus lycopersici]
MTTQTIKLTSLTTKGGCGCKIGPSDLAEVMHMLPPQIQDPNLLVGLDTSDDAGVYRLTDDLAMVQTLDFFTPIVDDPYDFGQVAATNAMSDIYAMGGKPLTALNIVAFPISTLDKSILAEILRGASDKLQEAGVTLVGGHSIDDQEPKFGLSVTGIVHPNKVLTNAGAKVGDKLILTKPIGVGILTTALKRGLLTTEQIDRVTKVMTTLNKSAAEIIKSYEVHACTDVTGFGLLGHATEMAAGAQVGLKINKNQVPILEGAKAFAENGVLPGGSRNNYAHVKNMVTFSEAIDETDQYILCDAVTSGGLLISVASSDAETLLHELQQAGLEASIIGEVIAEHAGHVLVD